MHRRLNVFSVLFDSDIGLITLVTLKALANINCNLDISIVICFVILFQAIQKWISKNSVPSIWEFNQNNAQKMFAQKAKTQFLYFIKGGDVQKQIKPLISISKEFKDEIVFVYVDSNTASGAQFMNHFGIDDKMLPMYSLFEVSHLNMYS